MNVGTKSLLFGVHQFLWHPWTVGRAWRVLYNRWPTFYEWVCIFSHDLGYWGCPDMDGECGKDHPIKGARIAASLIYRLHKFRLAVQHPFRWSRDPQYREGAVFYSTLRARGAFRLCVGHSRHTAKQRKESPSELCWPDKLSIEFDPKWFYRLRGWLSGETLEYVKNAKSSIGSVTVSYWFDWYRDVTLSKTAIAIQNGELRREICPETCGFVVPVIYARRVD